MPGPPPRPHPSFTKREVRHARNALQRHDPLWPEQLTVMLAIVLTAFVPDELTLGPSWLLPAIESVMLAGLVATTPRHGEGEHPRRRHLRIGLVGLLSAGNAISVFLLARYLVQSHNQNGRSLLLGGIIVWLTAVLLFALWYWELDRGGPVQRGSAEESSPDFMFPEMQGDWAPPDWAPQLVDYLYLSLVNAATFAPPESHVPITHIAKLVMSLQSLASLATIALVVARAVNILGS
jgi:uncharacterized membrane protein